MSHLLLSSLPNFFITTISMYFAYAQFSKETSFSEQSKLGRFFILFGDLYFIFIIILFYDLIFITLTALGVSFSILIWAVGIPFVISLIAGWIYSPKRTSYQYESCMQCCCINCCCAIYCPVFFFLLVFMAPWFFGSGCYDLHPPGSGKCFMQ